MGYFVEAGVNVIFHEGSAIRRLRCYSEGEETMGVSSVSSGVGPLPDIVPNTYGRERSLSVPDLEYRNRQRQRARELGRELRRISDEFQRNVEEARGAGRGPLFPFHHLLHPHANTALAALHAELNGVAAYFLSGVRRLLFPGWTAYFRYIFHITRYADASPGQIFLLPPLHPPSPDSSVDAHP